ncbi:MAG: CPBP family intramembrane metalloprotease [Promethearchaeota archaeon]|nr:MAG: CPBP family intramembrane metalloprotease [Candidatus Lokiarchaeota archaeon]
MDEKMEFNDDIIDKIKQKPWLFFILTYAWTWSFWIPLILFGQNVFLFPYFLLLGLGGLGPPISAIFLTYFKEDREIWHDYWKRIIDFKRIGVIWLAVALLLPAVRSGLAMATGILINGIFPSFDTAIEFLSDPRGLGFYLIFTLIYGPLPEEISWRGYALDRLQKRWNATYSSIILGIFWGLWHWPMFLMVGTYQSGELTIGSIRFWLNFVFGIIAVSIVMTWIYNNTNRSTLSAILSHFMMNFTGEFLNLMDILEYYKGIWTIIIAVLVVIIYGPKKLVRKSKDERVNHEKVENFPK